MRRRLRLLGGTTAVAAMILAGCGTQSAPPKETDTASGGTVTVAETNAFFAFNPDTSETNMDINTKVVGTTRSDFQYINPDLELVKDTSFGTIEKVSDDPMTVTYHINPDVAWSDGNKVDKADMLLEWAVMSGHFNGADPDKGPSYFDFAGDTDGLGLTGLPDFSDDTTMTVVYEKPYVDWEIAFAMGTAQPAHVVAKRAGMSEDELVDLLTTAKPGEDNEKLAAVAKVWNEDFISKTLPSEPELYLSDGPMIVSEMVEDQSVILKRNDSYTGALKPKLDEIVVKFIGDASAQIQALQNQEADIIAPQPETDTVEKVKELKDVTVLEGAQLSYDHVDLSFDSDVFKDADVRKAFLLTIPREDILDKLIRPMYDDATVVNSQIFLPTDGEKYTASVAANGSSAYNEVNIDEAKSLLKGKTPTVRILYNSKNPIRVDAFGLIQESASKAGFKIVDQGAEDWGQKLGSGTYDASLFGWVNPGVGSAGIPQLFKTNGGGNYSAYSNPQVDALCDQLLVEADPDKAQEIKQQIDALLWGDAFGVPLFQGPGLQAFHNNVTGIKYMPNQTGVWWNFWEWGIDG